MSLEITLLLKVQKCFQRDLNAPECKILSKHFQDDCVGGMTRESIKRKHLHDVKHIMTSSIHFSNVRKHTSSKARYLYFQNKKKNSLISKINSHRDYKWVLSALINLFVCLYVNNWNRLPLFFPLHLSNQVDILLYNR